MLNRFIVTGLIMIVLLGFTGGCAALLIGGGAAVGAGTVAYVRGELKATDEVSLDTAWNAAEDAMKDLQFIVVDQHKDALQAKLKARTATDRRVVILLKKQGERLTDIRIRVGTFGDQSLSRLILDKIKARYR